MKKSKFSLASLLLLSSIGCASPNTTTLTQLTQQIQTPERKFERGLESEVDKPSPTKLGPAKMFHGEELFTGSSPSELDSDRYEY
jgi:hypothetical protein